MPFNVGDRVVARNPLGRTAPGTICTKGLVAGGNIGVAFDHWCAGHHCEGACEHGYGYFIRSDHVKPLEHPTWHNINGTVFHNGGIFLEKLPIDQAKKVADILNGYEYLLRPPLQNPPPTTDT